MSDSNGKREGSLDAPTRHPLAWETAEFYDEDLLNQELERVFDICHGCRRCFNLCNAFPTLFDAVDESDTMEVDGVPREVFWDVVDNCYLCDMCYRTKCPYVPPHEWNVDFPHLMLRAKAARYKQQGARRRDRLLSSTDALGRFAGIPVVVQAVNANNHSKVGRKLLEKTLGVHRDAPVPDYHSKTAHKRLRNLRDSSGEGAVAAGDTRGRVVLYTTCYGNRNMPSLAEDFVAVYRHNDIPVALAAGERCCGMPKLELGDLDAVAKAKETNIPLLAEWIDRGWDIVTPIPSCTLMYKQELPLMYPDDEDVIKVRDALYDPFEYLMLRHKHGQLKTDFKKPLGAIAYQVPCHLRVQNIGLKTRDILELVPDTKLQVIERCSGHDGTYALKKEFHEISKRIARPVVNKIKKGGAQRVTSDCPMAGAQIAAELDTQTSSHPLNLLREAYGL